MHQIYIHIHSSRIYLEIRNGALRLTWDFPSYIRAHTSIYNQQEDRRMWIEYFVWNKSWEEKKTFTKSMNKKVHTLHQLTSSSTSKFDTDLLLKRNVFGKILLHESVVFSPDVLKFATRNEKNAKFVRLKLKERKKKHETIVSLSWYIASFVHLINSVKMYVANMICSLCMLGIVRTICMVVEFLFSVYGVRPKPGKVENNDFLHFFVSLVLLAVCHKNRFIAWTS